MFRWRHRQEIHQPQLLVALYGEQEPPDLQHRGRLDFTLGLLPELPPVREDEAPSLGLIKRVGRLTPFLDTGPRAVWKDEKTYLMLSGCQQEAAGRIISYVAVTISQCDDLCCIATIGCAPGWSKQVREELAHDLQLRLLETYVGAGKGHACLALNTLALASSLHNKGGTFPFLERYPESAGFLQHHRDQECSLS